MVCGEWGDVCVVDCGSVCVCGVWDGVVVCGGGVVRVLRDVVLEADVDVRVYRRGVGDCGGCEGGGDRVGGGWE